MPALLIVMFFALAGSASPQTQGGVITGRIVSLDGTPAAQKRIAAQAVLNRDDVALGASMMAGISQTDNDGRFRLENIPPGRYYIVIDPLDLPSYYPGVTRQERATIVSVAEGSLIEGLDFKVPDFDGGKIFGRLSAPPRPLTGPIRVSTLNVQGLGASGNNTAILQAIINSANSSGVSGVIGISVGGIVLQLTTPLTSAQTVSALVNADGTFELPKLRSGTYTIATNPNIGLSTATVEVDDIDVHDVALVVPGTTPATSSGVTVRGHIVEDPIPELLSQLTVVLNGGGASTSNSNSVHKVPVNPDGTFAIPNVDPGSYTAMTIPMASVSRHTTVDIGDQNVDDLEVVPPYTIEVSGHIELADGSKLKTASPLIVEAYHADVKAFGTTIQPDGTFKMHLLAGDNRILLRGVPAGDTLVSMTYEGFDILHRPLIPDLGDNDGIKILLAPAVGEALHAVRGRVEGIPTVAIGPASKIVLAGSGNGRRIVETALMPDGTFDFDAVPSDTYTAHVDGAPFASELKFDVGADDVQDLRMKGEVRSEIAGRVQIVDRNGTKLPDFPFSYLAMEFAPATAPAVAAVLPDGTFNAALSRGEYVVSTNRLPDGYTVKSISAGGTDLIRGKLKIDGKSIPEIGVTLEYRPKTNP